MAVRTILLLLVTTMLLAPSQGQDRLGSEWKVGDWMREYEDKNSKTETCYQQLLADNERMQTSLSEMTSSQRLHEQLIRDLEVKHQQQGEMWKLKLQIAELRVKTAEEEARRQCSQSCEAKMSSSKAEIQGLFVATNQKLEKVEVKLENCQNETKQLVREAAEYRLNITVSAAVQNFALLLKHGLTSSQNEEKIKLEDKIVTLESDLKNFTAENNLLTSKLEVCEKERKIYGLDMENSLKDVENKTRALNSSLAECHAEVKSKSLEVTDCNQKASAAAESHRTELEQLQSQLKKEKESKIKTEKNTEQELQSLIKNLEKASLHTIRGHVYFTQLVGHTWAKAADKCDSLNMKIISLEKQEKWNLIKEYTRINYKANLDGWYWSSAQRVGTNWKWNATGESVNFFTQLEPYRGKLNTEHCMIVKPTVGWREITCMETGAYVICE